MVQITFMRQYFWGYRDPCASPLWVCASIEGSFWILVIVAITTGAHVVLAKSFGELIY